MCMRAPRAVDTKYDVKKAAKVNGVLLPITPNERNKAFAAPPTNLPIIIDVMSAKRMPPKCFPFLERFRKAEYRRPVKSRKPPVQKPWEAQKSGKPVSRRAGLLGAEVSLPRRGPISIRSKVRRSAPGYAEAR